jgi:hypothetical protein
VTLEACAHASDLRRTIKSLADDEEPRRARSASLQGQRLLVLDNLEHLLPIDVEVARLLKRDSGLWIIVVSRVPTQIAGEHEVALPPP